MSKWKVNIYENGHAIWGMLVIDDFYPHDTYEKAIEDSLKEIDAMEDWEQVSYNTGTFECFICEVDDEYINTGN